MPGLARVLIVLIVLVAVSKAGPPPDDATRLTASFGFVGLGDGDLDATYDLLPRAEVGASWRLAPATRLAVSVGYASVEGDPYYDVDGFDGNDGARLRVVPVTVAVRRDLIGDSSLRVVGGFAMQAAWIEERLPTGETESGYETYDGRAFGVELSVGPELWLAGGRHAVGLEFTFGGPMGELQQSTRRHDIDLSGVGLRLGYTLALGSLEGSR